MNNLSVKEKEEKILKLKEEKGALILAHYYQNLEIQHVADFCGDSFELAKIARTSDKEIIIFCGVSFMAESAKIMNPEKRVFIPRKDAGCLMADMATPEIINEMKKAHPGACVVCYINSSADTKAVSDICVTSANATKVVSTLEEKEIIFVPDKNLGSFVKDCFPEKTFYFMDGFCPVHNDLSEKDILLAKEKYPDAPIVIHPECKKELLRHGDCIGSTSAILDYCRESDKNEFLVGTECAIVERLKEEFPDKRFHLISPCLVCPDMKKTSLDDLLETLENFSNEVIMTEEKMCAARLPLERMLESATEKQK